MMQRDLGNEVIVAILAIGALVFALAFGIVLSLSGAGSETPLVTQVLSPTAVVVAQEEELTTLTPFQDQPETEEPVPTDTPQPTDTPTLRPTTIEPSATLGATDTNTPRPTATPTVTRRPSETPAATFTLTHTSTASPSATSTPSGVCATPDGWSIYVVRPGDTLDFVARAVGITADELQSGNCLPRASAINPGNVLYVPRQPYPYERPPVTVSVLGTLAAEGCTDPNAQVSSPVSGQRVRGVFQLMGTAAGGRFAAYRLEVRPDFATYYDVYAEHDRRVQNGELGTIDSNAYGRGLHWVRLRVVDAAGMDVAETCVIPMVFD